MNVQQIIDKARRLTYTNSTQYGGTSEVDALQDLNEVYQDLVTTITNRVNEDYFYDIFTSDTVIGQNEYTFQLPTSTVKGMNKLKELYIKYTASGDYKRAKNVSESTLENTPDWHKTNQSAENPIFYIADNSVFIFPAPTEAVTGGIKGSVSIIPIDLILADTEAKIKLQRQHHNTLVFGLLPYIFQQKGMINEKNDALATYERMKNDLIMKLSDRDLSPLETSLPDLSYYE